MIAPVARVLDCGVHVWETTAALAPYCEMPWRRVLEDGAAPPFTSDVADPLTAPADFALRRKAKVGPEALADELARSAADGALVFPDVMQRVGTLPTADYALALTRAYNRWLFERVLGHGTPLWGAVLTAPQNPEASAREIAAYARDARAAAVMVPVAGVDVLLGDRRYDPIYAAASEHQLPIVFHGGGYLTLPFFPGQPPELDTWFQRKTLSQPLLLMATLVSVLGTGVPARYPGLRFVFAGGGATWASHMIHRLDKEYNENRRDVPWLTNRPSLYFQRQMAVLTYPVDLPADRATLETFLLFSGYERNLIYASGFPYHDADGPDRIRQLPLGAELRDAILAGTAREFLPRLGDARAA